MPAERQQTSEPTPAFEDLSAWKTARKLRCKFTDLARRMPFAERSRLVDQVLRASRSVTANVAEGYEQFRRVHVPTHLVRHLPKELLKTERRPVTRLPTSHHLSRLLSYCTGFSSVECGLS